MNLYTVTLLVTSIRVIQNLRYYSAKFIITLSQRRMSKNKLLCLRTQEKDEGE